MKCNLCDRDIRQDETGEPVLEIGVKCLCYECYIGLIENIYNMAGVGDGGLVHLIYSNCLQSNHNRKRRKGIANYSKVMERLLHKYNFQCVECGKTKDLTIDHIKPVKLGGADVETNLQILCRSCNSKKGAKWNTSL